MRPPEHWHVRRTSGRSPQLWWAAFGVAVLVAGVFLLRAVFSGGDGSPDSAVRPAAASDVLAATSEPTSVYDVLPPEITGQAAAVIEGQCGELLYGLNAHERRAPASIAKIATALVVIDQANMTDTVSVEVNGALLRASSGSSVMGLIPGQQLSVRDLLYGLLLPSGNDAAIALADHIGGSESGFAILMNQKVASLRLEDTNFTNPHGLDDENNYTSAFDMAMLGRELLRQPTLAAIVTTQTYQPAWSGPPIWNGNRLIYDDPDVLGVKTGYTPEAGETIVAAEERGGRTLIVASLGAWDHYADAIVLLDWAFANVEPGCGASFAGP